MKEKIFEYFKKNSFQVAFTLISGMIFLKFVLNFSFLYIIFLIISIIIVSFLSNGKSKLSIIFTFGIILINIIVLVFSLIPTYEQNVEIGGFYKNQRNYLYITINDSQQELIENNATVIISNGKNKTKPTNSIILGNYNSYDRQILLDEGDRVSFNSKTNKLKTLINITLWDGTTFRILPQSIIQLDKLLIDQKNLLNSETKVSVEKGSTWFNVIKTITKDNSFNIGTESGILVIRGTSGFINYNNDAKNTLIYSNDHIIEIINNNGINELVSKGEIFKFNNNGIRKSSIEEFKNKFINNDIYQQIKDFQILDNEDFETYKRNFYDYIDKNFNWKYEKYNFIKTLSEKKMFILSNMPFLEKTREKYKSNIENYETFKTLMGKNVNIEYINNNIENIVLSPFNKTMEKVKLEYIKSNKISSIKHKLISVYNKALDSGKAVNIDEMKKWIKIAEDNQQIDRIRIIIEQIINNYLKDINFGQ